MESSILIAKILAVVYLSISLGMLFNWKYYRKALVEILKNSSFILFAGLIAASLGVVIIAYHNVWSEDWTSLITVIGWIALLKGIWLLVSPRELMAFTPLLEAKFSRWIILTVLLSLGLLFGWFGFIV